MPEPDDGAISGTAIHQAIRGDNPSRSLKKIAELAAGESPTVTADDWLVALPELNGVAVQFNMSDSLRDSYLWHEDGAYRASNLGPGLDHLEEMPLSREGAGGLLDGAVRPLSEPVPLEEVEA